MLLPDIAHINGAADRHGLGLDAAALQNRTAFADECGKHLIEFLERGRRKRRKPGAHKVIAQVRMQHAIGAKVAWCLRHEHPRHADFAGNGCRMQRSGTAVGNQRKRRSIQTAIGRHALDCITHRGHRNAQYSVGRRAHTHPERLGNLRANRALGGRPVQMHLAAEEALGTQTAQHQVGIGYRGLLSAASITGRARFGT